MFFFFVQEKEEEKAEGRLESKLEDVNTIRESLKITFIEAMDLLNIPEEERKQYMKRG